MRKTATALVALGLTAVLAPSAGAATVGFDGDGTLVVTAAPGETNRLGFQSAIDGRLVIYDEAGALTTSSSACDTMPEHDSVTCIWSPAAGARADLGDGNDWGYVSFGLPAGAPFAFSGGAGDDHLQSSSDGQPTRLDGGDGADRLEGGSGTDTLVGGDGNDILEGRGGADSLSAGGGDDVLAGDGNNAAAADVIDGGPGTDAIESDWSDPGFDAPEQPVTVTLIGGGDDGRPGEGDDVRAVERIVSHAPGRLVGGDAAEHLEVFQVGAPSELIGNGGNDVLKASDGADRVDGGDGDDDIDAGFGDDTIVGGPGADTISADRRGGECGPLWCKLPYGNDTIDVRDGQRDSVTCGAGADTVKADPIDVVAADCETVSGGATAGGGTGGPDAQGRNAALAATIRRVKLSAALAKGLGLRLTAPGPGRVIAKAKVKGKVAATGSRRVKKAGRTTVVLRFSKQARRRLRRERSVRLRVSVRFSPKGGAAVSQTFAVTLKR